MFRITSQLPRSFRSLRRAPAYTLTALLTLTLGLGLNVAIFSIAYGILLRPLDVPQPERLFSIGQDMEARGSSPHEPTSRGIFCDWRERSRSFQSLAAYIPYPADLNDLDPPENVQGAAVSHELFSVMGVEPSRGRGFLPEEEVQGDHFVAVLAHDLWNRRFGGDESLLGDSVTINDAQYTVVGILPEGFRAPSIPDVQVWTPLPLSPIPEDRGHSYVRAVGRLGSGISPEAARTEMDRIAADLAAQYPDALQDVGVTLRSLRETVVGTNAKWLWFLLAAASLVLLATCLNVASLAVGRETLRRQDTAVEVALGAGPRHLQGRILAESLLIGAGGGLLSLVAGLVGLRFLRAVAPPGTPRLDAIHFDGPVVLYGLGAALVCALLIGLIPLLRARQHRPAQFLGTTATTSDDRGSHRVRSALIAVEVALGVVLLLNTGLLVRTLDRLSEVDLGFNSENVTLGRVTLAPNRYPEPSDMASFLTRVERRLEGHPEISAAGSVTSMPLADGTSKSKVVVEGMPTSDDENRDAIRRGSSPGFFDALGLHAVEGRLITPLDTHQSTPVIVVNLSFVERYLEGRTTLGLRVRVGSDDNPDEPWRTIVGVVEDIRGERIDREPVPEVYVPITQWPPRIATLVIRAEGSARTAREILQTVPSQITAGQVVSRVTTMDQVVARELATRRFLGRLVGAFAGLTLLLIVVGLYGVITLAVAQRRTEIAIRQALGASVASAVRLVFVRTLGLVSAGLVLGLVLSVPAGRWLSSYLYGVEPMDPTAIVGVCLILLVLGLLAAVRPALWAARLDPARTLRQDA